MLFYLLWYRYTMESPFLFILIHDKTVIHFIYLCNAWVYLTWDFYFLNVISLVFMKSQLGYKGGEKIILHVISFYFNLFMALFQTKDCLIRWPVWCNSESNLFSQIWLVFSIGCFLSTLPCLYACILRCHGNTSDAMCEHMMPVADLGKWSRQWSSLGKSYQCLQQCLLTSVTTIHYVCSSTS